MFQYSVLSITAVFQENFLHIVIFFPWMCSFAYASMLNSGVHGASSPAAHTLIVRGNRTFSRWESRRACGLQKERLCYNVTGPGLRCSVLWWEEPHEHKTRIRASKNNARFKIINHWFGDEWWEWITFCPLLMLFLKPLQRHYPQCTLNNGTTECIFGDFSPGLNWTFWLNSLHHKDKALGAMLDRC